MPLQLMAAPDEHIVATARHDHEVVRDEPVSSLDEVQHTFRLPNATLAGEKKPNAEHVRERPVQRGRRREEVVEDRLDTAIELAGLEGRSEDRYFALGGDLLERRGKLLPLGHEDARQVEREEHAEDSIALLRRKRGEIRDLRLTERLQPLRRESVYISREYETRPRHVGTRHRAIKAADPYLVQRESPLEARDECADGHGSVHARASFLPRDLGVRFSWRACASRWPMAKLRAGPKKRALPSATIGLRRGV